MSAWPAPVRTAGVLACAAVVACAGAAAQAGTPAPRPATGIWISRAEVQKLPMRGGAWRRLKAAADADWGEADVSDQDSRHDVQTLAGALVYARTGKETYRRRVAAAVLAAIGTEAGGRTLALGRNLLSYVVAADLIDLRAHDPDGDARFRAWLARVRREQLDGRTLVGTHAERPNNWGTHAGASRIAADLYLGDLADLARATRVFQGYLGARRAYAGFRYGDLSWQADPRRPVGINPAGSSREGFSLDGIMPDDMRRGGDFRVPPGETEYPWEALQGAVAQARLLARRGLPAWRWENRALLRAVRRLAELEDAYGRWWADGNDAWIVWTVNRVYGTRFATEPIRSPGNSMSWTDWTDARPAR